MCDLLRDGTGAGIQSSSPAMLAAVDALAKASQTSVPVLLRGEGGSGKSVFARALHALSPRSRHPFVTIDCLGLGADPPLAQLRGRLAEAYSGTVHLEEVAALGGRWQAEMSLLLDGRPACAPGVDVRVVASTQRDLEGAVRANQFREDLLVGLGLVEIRVPPLRQRREDVVPLARHFLALFARAAGRAVPDFTPASERALVDYGWPGNVRELRNTMQRLVLLSGSSELDVDALRGHWSSRPVRDRGGAPG
ncbi:MAG TPA: sigma 54-interacting transcriptional regulator [Anaeromyxobacteraceae bacterium]|nr:sigma 54-interacting transcriptional regulator [Anaeromyxobacteraceae bacterium]